MPPWRIMWMDSATIVTRMTATATQMAASATRMITSTITDSVSRLVNASRIVVASHCHGGSTPVHGDAPPKRRRAAQTRPTGASATAAKARSDASNRVADREPAGCIRSTSSHDLWAARTAKRKHAHPAHGAACARADPAPGHGSAGRLHLEGDRDPVTDDVDRGDPAVEVVGVEQARRRALRRRSRPVRGRCRSARLAGAAGRRCRPAGRRTGPPGTRSTARRRDPTPPDRRHVPAR